MSYPAREQAPIAHRVEEEIKNAPGYDPHEPMDLGPYGASVDFAVRTSAPPARVLSGRGAVEVPPALPGGAATPATS